MPGEGGTIARMLRSSLAARLRPLTIWESPRAGHWVEFLLSSAPAADDAAFYVLRCGGAAGGIAALRSLQGRAFLNHFYLWPRWRARGFGARLLAHAVRSYAEPRKLRDFALDVLAGNTIAETWYARLGLIERERRGWWIAGFRPVPAGFEAVCEGLAEADRQHRAWGFSRFSVLTAAGRAEVGRLYAPYYRLTSAEPAFDEGLQQILAGLDRRRRLLLVAAGECPAGWKQAALSRRLECPVEDLLRNLRGA